MARRDRLPLLPTPLEHIDDERLDRYRSMFTVADVTQFGAQEGDVVLDYGCGPGALAVALAHAVGADGRVHAMDLNRELLAIAEDAAADNDVADRITFRQVSDGTIPLEDNSVDRVIFKAVLLYLDDPASTLAEARRVLRPGGVILCQDSDFVLSACTAFAPRQWRDFVEAISPAFGDPAMGRHLPALLAAAGFDDIATRGEVVVDEVGVMHPNFLNMVGYAGELGALPAKQLDEMLSQADASIENGSWLFALNIFTATGECPR